MIAFTQLYCLLATDAVGDLFLQCIASRTQATLLALLFFAAFLPAFACGCADQIIEGLDFECVGRAEEFLKGVEGRVICTGKVEVFVIRRYILSDRVVEFSAKGILLSHRWKTFSPI